MPNITRGEFNHAIHGQYRTSYRCWYWNGRGDYLPNLIQFSSQLDNSDPNYALNPKTDQFPGNSGASGLMGTRCSYNERR